MAGTNHRHKIIALLVAALCIALGLGSVQAQSPPGPIILNIEGDLWAWEGAGQPLIQLTDWRMNGAPILSPDGTRVAYTSISSIFVDWAQRQTGGGGGYYCPENIWLLDIPSGHTFRIADQPADAVWDGPNNPGRYIMRSVPAWSPDGQRLAWVELPVDAIAPTNDQPADTAQLVIHDLVSGTDEILASFPFLHSDALRVNFNVQWGRPGIAVKAEVGSIIGDWDLRIFDLSGGLITEVQYKAGDNAGLFSAVWIQDQDQDYLFQDKRTANTWLNWRTGQPEPAVGLPEMYSLSAPDGASFFLSGETWHLALPGQAAIDLGDSVQPYGISRDGQGGVYGRWEIDPAAGYHAYTVIAHFHDQLVEIGRFQSIRPVWGPVGWRVKR